MQDSMEDYIRMTKNMENDSEKDNIQISKEILATTQRKKECEAYAVNIVMFSLDGRLRPEIFLKCLKFINPDYYQDIVEERAITKLCGYPLCGKKIPEMPTQKYFISTKANKVYDISERKSYCSNFCYRGSIHVKNQIDTSPLWLRNHAEMVDCKLLPATAIGVPGEEIDQGLAKAATQLPTFTSVAQFTQISLEEAGAIEQTVNKKAKVNMRHKKSRIQQHSLDVIDEDDATDGSASEQSNFGDHNISDDDYNYSQRDNICKSEKNAATNKLKVNNKKETKQSETKMDTLTQKKHCAGDMKEKEKLEYLISKLKIKNEPKTKLIQPPPMKVEVKHTIENKPPKHKHSLPNNIMGTVIKETHNRDIPWNENEAIGCVKTYVLEWITIDTFIYIYGEERVRQVLNENKMGEYFDTLKITELETSQQLKYMNVCRRLHMQELAEEKFDNAILGNSLKPLPDFKNLKEEVQELDLKVKSFYKGVLYEKQDTNFPTKEVKANGEELSNMLPLVDISAQNALRRKVLLNSINKTLKKFSKEMELEERYILSCIHELVKSFKLQANNIIFKPATWPLVAVILLKMLSLKDTKIQNQLKEPRFAEYIDLILSDYTGVDCLIEDIFTLLSNIDRFVESYITQKR